jgi:hypothetical protein
VLEEYGFVVNEMEGTISGPFAFEKTPAGAGFGDAIAAQALWFGRRPKSVRRSMLRIFGAPHPSSSRCRVLG